MEEENVASGHMDEGDVRLLWNVGPNPQSFFFSLTQTSMMIFPWDSIYNFMEDRY